MEKKCIKCKEPIIEPACNRQLLCNKCRAERKLTKTEPIPKILQRSGETKMNHEITTPEAPASVYLKEQIKNLTEPEPIKKDSFFEIADKMLKTMSVNHIEMTCNYLTIKIDRIIQ